MMQPASIAELDAANKKLESLAGLLRDSRRDWIETVDAISDPLFVAGPDFRVVRCNRAYAARAGMPFSEIIGRAYWECFPKAPGHRPEIDAAFAEIAGPDGAVFLARAYPVGGTGQAGRTLHVLVDITGQRRAEERLALVSLVAQKSASVLFRTRAGAGWPIEYASSNVAAWGYDAALLMREEASFASLIHPHDLPALAERFERAESRVLMEFRILTRSGESRWVAGERLVERDPQGRVIRYQGIATDITERRELEEARARTLRRTQAQLESVGRISLSEALVLGEVQQLAREITEEAARVCGVERANLWLFNDDESELRCIDHYEAGARCHSAGAVLKQSQFASQFNALQKARYVDASDALTDPRTAGYVEGYLRPAGITAMLDAAVQLAGRHLGFLRLEHVGGAHCWEQDEIQYACQLADKIAIGITNGQRRVSALALKRSARELKEAQRLGGLGSWTWDAASDAVSWSEEVSRMFGRDPGLPAPKLSEHGSLLTPKAWSELRSTMACAVEDGIPYEIDLEIMRAEGNAWITVRGESLRDSTGRITGLRGTALDITERKAAESEIQVLARFPDENPNPVMRISADGRLLYANQASSALRGCFAAEVGQLVAPAWIARVREHMAAGVAARIELEHHDRVYVLAIAPIPAHAYLNVYGVDITERRRAEEAVRASRDLLQSVVENAPVRVFWKARDLRFLGCNRLFAVDAGHARAEELIGKDDYQTRWREQADRYRADDNAVMDADAPKLGFIEPQTAADGRRIWLRTSKVPLHGPDGKVFGLLGLYDDITREKEAAEALVSANRGLRVLSAGNLALMHAADEEGLLGEMTRILHEVGGYPIAFVSYAKHDAQRLLEPQACVGIDAELLRSAPASWGDNDKGQSAASRALRLGSTQVEADVARSPAYARWAEFLRSKNIRCAVGLPLCMANGEAPFGVLGIGSADENAFDGEELKLLQDLAGDLAYGIAHLRAGVERRAADGKLRRGLEATVAAIAATMETRDPYTAGHQRRVADLGAAIAREMKLSPAQVEGIHFGGLIHDLGKIQVPAEILAKPAKLTRLEFDMIKQHPQAGYDIIKGIEFPWPVAEMVHQHHERLDGSGYPQGLKGEQIVLEARVLAVADVVEAMASHRPYRPGRGIDAALREIEAQRAVGFDPVAVDACLRLFREKRYSLEVA